MSRPLLPSHLSAVAATEGDATFLSREKKAPAASNDAVTSPRSAYAHAVCGRTAIKAIHAAYGAMSAKERFTMPYDAEGL